ncbi:MULTISPECIES: ABC transporter permease [Gracilibacillus]|uniref:ABC transporter permease n=1 Tax=Gracilibacillus TaxID=74385 RepID=UPI0008265A64|nr:MULTISPECIES: ABC transporter permease [Gracilibacillus]
MKDILYTRLLLFKKQWLSLGFWLLLPVLITVSFLTIADNIQDDFRVPIGIVLEEENEAVSDLYEEIQASELVTVTPFSESEALRKVQQHELDSVFIVREGYQEQIRAGERSDLLAAYHTNRSLAYQPVKEMIVSIIQQTTGRVKAAEAVQSLEQQIEGTSTFTTEEIIATSQQIQQEEDLLHHVFRYQGEERPETDEIIQWNPWMAWAFTAFLMTLFIFDWVSKERQASVAIRLPFMRHSFPVYMLLHLLVYFLLFLIIDLGTAALFYLLYDETISILTLLTYRLMLCLFAFLFVWLIRRVYASYIAAIVLTIVLVMLSATVLPFGNSDMTITWLTYINPLYPFLSGEPTISWLIICLIGIAIWFVREEKKHA